MEIQIPMALADVLPKNSAKAVKLGRRKDLKLVLLLVVRSLKVNF